MVRSEIKNFILNDNELESVKNLRLDYYIVFVVNCLSLNFIVKLIANLYSFIDLNI
ncbi:hypothetical protein C1N83_00185 [Priestia aryabhattai]